MSKFNVGDTVRIRSDVWSGSGLDVGSEHNVVCAIDDGCDIAGNDGRDYYFYDDQLELVSRAGKTFATAEVEDTGTLSVADAMDALDLNVSGTATISLDLIDEGSALKEALNVCIDYGVWDAARAIIDKLERLE